MVVRALTGSLILATLVIGGGATAAEPDGADASSSELTMERPDGEVFRLHGKYSYMADAARFTECRSGRTWNVWPESAAADVEAAYLGTKPEPGQEVVVAVDAHLALRPALEGDEMGEVIVIDGFVEILERADCPPDGPPTLENTFWKLVALEGEPVKASGFRETPHVRFSSEDARVAGFGGCNRFFGAAKRGDGAALKIGPVGATLMACPAGMELEREFLALLNVVDEFGLEGEFLELRSDGGVVARFEAVHF